MGSKKQPRKASSLSTSSVNIPHAKQQPSSTNNTKATEEEEDFCQRFFGDPLFTNLNVFLLFLLATILPMLVWIPHFINEYAKIRRSSVAEGERLKRMEQSRIDLIPKDVGLNMEDYEEPVLLPDGKLFYKFKRRAVEQVIQTPFSEDDVTVFVEDVFGVKSDEGVESGSTSVLLPRKTTVLPKLCPDGRTMGFDNWFTLRDAILEANALAAEDFLRWNKYLVMSLEDPEVEEPVFPAPDPFVICPGAKLNQRHPPRMSILGWLTSFFVTAPPTQYKPNNSKLSPIFINAEDITIECDRCLIDLPGTHFSFGPHARNSWIRGVTFKGATTSSLVLHHHGATAIFEDCYWLHNSGGLVASKNNPIGTINMEGSNVGGTMNAGAVADVNSTSSVTFYRCSIDDHRQNPRRATVGAGELPY
jgi:hypothetical protein